MADHNGRVAARLQYGPSERVRGFLLSLLAPTTGDRYQQAFQQIMDYAAEVRVTFGALSEEEQDYFIADCVLETVDAGGTLQSCRYMVAAAQKFYAGRRRFSAASRVIEGIASANPPVQAAPFP